MWGLTIFMKANKSWLEQLHRQEDEGRMPRCLPMARSVAPVTKDESFSYIWVSVCACVCVCLLIPSPHQNRMQITEISGQEVNAKCESGRDFRLACIIKYQHPDMTWWKTYNASNQRGIFSHSPSAAESVRVCGGQVPKLFFSVFLAFSAILEWPAPSCLGASFTGNQPISSHIIQCRCSCVVIFACLSGLHLNLFGFVLCFGLDLCHRVTPLFNKLNQICSICSIFSYFCFRMWIGLGQLAAIRKQHKVNIRIICERNQPPYRVELNEVEEVTDTQVSPELSSSQVARSLCWTICMLEAPPCCFFCFFKKPIRWAFGCCQAAHTWCQVKGSLLSHVWLTAWNCEEAEKPKDNPR